MRQSESFEIIKSKFPQINQEEPTKAVIVPKGILLDVVGYLKSGELAFDCLHNIVAIDKKDNIEIIYIFYSFNARRQITLKVNLAIESPEVETLTVFYKAADWFEREVYDLFGVNFLNHPNLCRILNPLDWKGHPLRKDYSRQDFIKKPRY